MLNEKIKDLRKSFHLSQTELAAELNVSKQCISNWENDNVQPSIAMLVRLAEFFSVSTDYLLGFREDENSVSVEGLTEAEKAHIKLLIADLRRC